MDAVDLFRKLGAGAKFDLKRFAKDAERFKVGRPQRKDISSSDILAGIDFFSTDTKNQHDEKEDEEEQDCAVQVEQLRCTTKRKKDLETINLRRRKKKNVEEKSQPQCTSETEDQSAEVQQEETEGEGIQWTSSINRKTRAAGAVSKDKNRSLVKRLKHLHQEKVNRVRHRSRIHVHGTDLPDPVTTFEELQEEYKLDPRIVQTLRAAGFRTPTPIQMQAVPLMLHRREILACAPTGSGKTVAFCLPLLAHLRQPANRGFRALIISPTRELASQTHRELLKLSDSLGFRVHIIDKGADAARKYGPKSARKFDILVTTPNRLIYLLKQDPPAVDLSSVEWLVVDESDKLFEDGKTGFREQLAIIFLACSSPNVRRAFFSATFTLEVEQWCRLNLDNLVSVTVGPRNSAVDTVEQQLLFVGTENGKLVAMRDLIRKGFMPPVLVFVQSIERAQELFHELVYEGVNVDVIHANRTQQQRDNVVRSFRSGKIWVLICTALLARGIDFKGVNVVINYDFPTSAVEYIHRIGRTGRAGHKGKAVTFFTEDDKPLLRSIAGVVKQAGCPVPDYMVGLKKMHSKLKRRLQKKPPRRTTIRTTPRFLMRKGGAKRKSKKKEKTTMTTGQRGGGGAEEQGAD